MEVAITGSSGLIGTALRAELARNGDRPIRIVRRQPKTGQDEIFWDPAAGKIDTKSLDGVDAVVNLAGAGIGDRRWTESYRKTLVESRVNSTALLAVTCAGAKKPPTVLLSGSAIGFYGDRGDEVLVETSDRGQGFLADLVVDWEAAAQPASDAGIRTALLRTGIVFATEGGALAKLLPLFKLGVGGKFGSGKQYMSWISIDDYVSAIGHLLTNEVSGPVNLTAPQPVTNAELTEVLGQVLKRPTMFPVPKFAPRLLLGSDRADALLFEGARVTPEVLTSSGFQFEHRDVKSALVDLLN